MFKKLNFPPEGKPQHHQQQGQPWQRLQTDKDEEHNLQKNHFLFLNQNNLNSVTKQITIVVKDIQFHDCWLPLQ